MGESYKGKYILKNHHKYEGNKDKIVFRSLWELSVCRWADLSSVVQFWSSEETIVPYYFPADKKYHRYFIDFKFKFSNNRTVLVEIKPGSQTRKPEKKSNRMTKRYLTESLTYMKNCCKWEAAEKYAAAHGWEFDVWSEAELAELGIKILSNQYKY